MEDATRLAQIVRDCGGKRLNRLTFEQVSSYRKVEISFDSIVRQTRERVERERIAEIRRKERETEEQMIRDAQEKLDETLSGMKALPSNSACSPEIREIKGRIVAQIGNRPFADKIEPSPAWKALEVECRLRDERVTEYKKQEEERLREQEYLRAAQLSRESLQAREVNATALRAAIRDLRPGLFGSSTLPERMLAFQDYFLAFDPNWQFASNIFTALAADKLLPPLDRGQNFTCIASECFSVGVSERTAFGLSLSLTQTGTLNASVFVNEDDKGTMGASYDLFGFSDKQNVGTAYLMGCSALAVLRAIDGERATTNSVREALQKVATQMFGPGAPRLFDPTGRGSQVVPELGMSFSNASLHGFTCSTEIR